MKSTGATVDSSSTTTASGPSTASTSQAPTASTSQVFSSDRLSDRSQSQAMAYLNRSHLQTILDSKQQ